MEYSKDVKELEKKIQDLEIELRQQEEQLKIVKKKEWLDYHGITLGKTVVKHRGEEYLVSSIEIEEYLVSSIEIYAGTEIIYGKKKLKNGWGKHETHLANWEIK